MTGKNWQDDLDAFQPSSGEKRLDDKAAQLEKEIAFIKVEARRIHFVLSFISSLFFLLFVASVASNAAIFVATAGVLIFLIGLGKWLEFPWIVLHLESWHDALLQKFKSEKGNPRLNEEPLPEKIQDENNA